VKKKKKFTNDADQNEDMSLQVTSMADIFTIILVFLLKSYSTGVSNISPSQGVLLPEAKAQPQMKDALKVEILRDSVLVDQKQAVSLKNFSFINSDANAVLAKEAPATGGDVSAEISKALMAQRKNMTGNEIDSHLLLLADQRTPYATLRRVMNSAASAGFVDLQLAVVQAD
jgi:biopolymer transport protein ExbD